MPCARGSIGSTWFRLELTSPGFDLSVLSEFRSRLVATGAERRPFDLLLSRFRERGWIKARGKQRTDSTHVLAAIRTIRRLECVGETMRHARGAPGRSRARLAPGVHGPGVGRTLPEAFQRFSPAQRCEGTGGIGRNDWGRWSSALRTGVCREQSSLVRGPGCRRNAAARLDTTLSRKSSKGLAFRADQELPPSALLITSPGRTSKHGTVGRRV